MNRLRFCVPGLLLMALVATIRAGEEAPVSGVRIELDFTDGSRAVGTPLRLEVELVDGSHLVGVPGFESLPLRTPYARTVIPLRLIAAVEIAADRETALVHTTDGDRLTGVISRESFPLETLFGSVEVGLKSVVALRFPVDLDGYLVHGQTQGLQTDFVTGIPEAVARPLKRVTRTVNCYYGGGPERSAAAPWLYPGAPGNL
jgi:hypothetical protein